LNNETELMNSLLVNVIDDDVRLELENSATDPPFDDDALFVNTQLVISVETEL